VPNFIIVQLVVAYKNISKFVNIKMVNNERTVGTEKPLGSILLRMCFLFFIVKNSFDLP
jgi:hypothetical protein